MISEATVSKVKEIAQVQDVASLFVNLQKRGHALKACCPFHSEKTPSFTVSPVKNTYKCFGCGKGGDAIQFYVDLGYTFTDAVRELAKFYKIPIDEVKDNSLKILEYACSVFEKGSKDYFLERGISEEMISLFRLGHHYDIDYFDKQKAFELGLLYDNGNHVFAARWIFPLQNANGEVIGFAGRTNRKDAAKYLNTKQTALYHKSYYLYGLYQSKNEIRKKDEAVLVEGYFAVITCHQFGIKNVVASSGTSLTKEQVQNILVYSKNITVAYDGDKAGTKAYYRALEIILPLTASVSRIKFENDQDPDDAARAGFEFTRTNWLDDILSLLEGTEGDKRVKIMDKIISLLNLIGNYVQRRVYIEKFCLKTGFDESFFKTTYKNDNSEAFFTFLMVKYGRNEAFDIVSDVIEYLEDESLVELLDVEEFGLPELVNCKQKHISERALSLLLEYNYFDTDNPLEECISSAQLLRCSILDRLIEEKYTKLKIAADPVEEKVLNKLLEERLKSNC